MNRYITLAVLSVVSAFPVAMVTGWSYTWTLASILGFSLLLSPFFRDGDA